MNLVSLLLLAFILTIYSCMDNSGKKDTNKNNHQAPNTSEIHPNDLFQKNCAMCHGYNNDLTAPAINSYSVDSVLNFYDGNSRNDSVWEQHKKIQLTRKDWERIAVQMQPGDLFPNKQTSQQIMNEANSTKRPFLIKLTNIDEVRMGSPFKHCDIELVGFDKVKLPISGWQDKYAWSEDSLKLVLIKWDFENNTPGFHLFMINIETGQTKESPKLFGLTKNISLKGDKVKLIKFLYDKEKSKPGHLCCEVEEEFEFT